MALAVYHYLADRTGHSSDKYSYLLDAMLLKTYLIRELGNVPGDPVLDSDLLRRWFFDNLTMSREDALNQAQKWQDKLISKTVNRSDLKTTLVLRQLRQRLSLLASLVESGQLRSDAEIAGWLAIRSYLP